jgi:hypothetical protein
VSSETEELILSIVRAASVGPSATPKLRAAVRSYVRGLKASGYSPEEVFVAVKALLAEAGIKHRGRSVRSRDAELADRIVAWCIAAYFAPDTDAPHQDMP